LCDTNASTSACTCEPTSALGLGSPLPHLRRDWAHPCHICAGTGLTPATSAPGLGLAPLPTSAPRLGSPPPTSAPGLPRTVLPRLLHPSRAGREQRMRTDARVRVCRAALRLRVGKEGQRLLTPVQSRCRSGSDGPGPGADVGAVGPVPVQMWRVAPPGP
jgi:hypothetical protein